MIRRAFTFFADVHEGGLCHDDAMRSVAVMETQLTPKLVDSLYVEAMILADEVRSYFDEPGRAEREALPPVMRVSFSCESLKVTTRLMHVIAWLLMRRAVEAGELTPVQARAPDRRLGRAQDSDAAVIDELPPTARALITASRDLYDRIDRLDRELAEPAPASSPAHGLVQRLREAF